MPVFLGRNKPRNLNDDDKEDNFKPISYRECICKGV